MTAIERVRRTRAALLIGAVGTALAWGVAATLSVLALSAFATRLAQRDAQPDWVIWIALAAGAAVTVALLWRARHVTSITRVALWTEERIPGLHYSLVTAIEQPGDEQQRLLEKTVEGENIGGVTSAALVRHLGPALAAAAAAVALLYVSPSAALGGPGLFARNLPGRSVSGIPAGSRIDDISVVVTPPAYAGGSSTSLDNPAAIQALAGSRVTVRGAGSPAGITAAEGSTARPAGAGGRGWQVTLTMPSKPAPLMLRDRDHERIVVLEPRTDNPPRVVLTSPTRDTTLRTPRLALELRATASDDIGLETGYFEYLITTGSGEIFNARTVTTPPVTFRGARNGSLSAALELASLRLGPGDVVSIRAITRDRNTLSGPGIATSETRTFRIARADEYDSVAVDPAGPLPVDSSAISQRMLIMMTEQLVREQPRLERPEVVRRSTEIGDAEERIRHRVHDILYEAEEEEAAEAAPGEPETHAHGEVTMINNPDLFEAYNALNLAVRALMIAEPDSALPHMRAALKALDRARLANRLYLRGLPPRVIVDIARVRMTGKEKGSGSMRTPISPADTARLRLERRFAEVIEVIPRDPAAAIRALTLLQVDGLSVAPSFASAIGEALAAFRNGRDATIPLLRARRALSGEPVSRPGLPAWSSGG